MAYIAISLIILSIFGGFIFHAWKKARRSRDEIDRNLNQIKDQIILPPGQNLDNTFCDATEFDPSSSHQESYFDGNTEDRTSVMFPPLGNRISLVIGEQNKQELDDVFLAASIPEQVRPGDEFIVRFMAYIESLEKYVMEYFATLSPTAVSSYRLRHCRWQQGTNVLVKLYANHITVGCPEESFIWSGTSNLVEFEAFVSANAPTQKTVLKIDVIIGGFVIAKLRLDLEINARLFSNRVIGFKTQPAFTAFASYASKDRLRVLDRIAEIQRIGVDVFLDCLSLHPGERWKPILEKEIKDRELFLLFWSKNAQKSRWVTWEWRTALKTKGLSGIDPHPLDPVTDAAPPRELSDLHFGDQYMLIRKALDK